MDIELIEARIRLTEQQIKQLEDLSVGFKEFSSDIVTTFEGIIRILDDLNTRFEYYNGELLKDD